MSNEQLFTAAIAAQSVALITLWRVMLRELRECNHDRRALWARLGVPVPPPAKRGEE